MTTMNEPARLEIVYKPIDSLHDFENNSRTHSDEQIDQLVASMNERGWTQPILIDGDDGIIAGHARKMAGKRRGDTEVPTICLAHLTADQVRAYVIADNKLAENAGWDMEILSSEMRALLEAGYDMDLLAFDPKELAQLLALPAEEGLTDPDDSPDVDSVNVVTHLRDVWVLGDHRLVCGDATAKEYVDLALNGVVPGLMVTDPPYGVNYDPSWRKKSGLAGEGNLAEGKVMNDDRADWREAWALFPGNVCYVWHAGTKAHIVSASLEASGFDIRSQVVWVKNRFAISRGHYHVQHEPAFEARRDEDNAYAHEIAQYSVRKGNTAGWEGDRKQSSVWFIEHRVNDTGHGTQKPVECMERPIRNNSSPGMAVYEPFCGSGTTIIACQRTGRYCHSLELDPVYCDLIVRRWEAYTGQEAVLESSGQTFLEVTADRLTLDEDESGTAPVAQPHSSASNEDLEDAGLKTNGGES